MKKLAYHDAAEQELINEVLHLEGRATGLGRKLQEEVRRAEEFLRATPDAAPEVFPKLRAKVLRKFRYSMIYTIESDSVFVLAFAHHRRRPMYWLDRVEQLED